MEITAGNQVESNSPASGGEGEGVVNSEGTIVAPGTPSGQGGLVQIGGSSGDEVPISGEGIEWKAYTDEKYGYSVNYPISYVILPEGDLDLYTGAKPLHVVRFQDEVIAKGDLADREPPKFSIEIFTRPASVPLKDWILSNKFASNTADYEAIELIGAKEGLKVSLRILMDPNTFYYFATEQYIYRIVPSGQYSQEMRASFKLNQ